MITAREHSNETILIINGSKKSSDDSRSLSDLLGYVPESSALYYLKTFAPYTNDWDLYSEGFGSDLVDFFRGKKFSVVVLYYSDFGVITTYGKRLLPKSFRILRDLLVEGGSLVIDDVFFYLSKYGEIVSEFTEPWKNFFQQHVSVNKLFSMKFYNSWNGLVIAQAE